MRRRVGDEVFERLVAPLLSGVHAGNADRLSLAAGAPQLAAALRDHESLIGGLQAQRAAADPERPVFFGLAHGTETLTDALVDALRLAGVDLRLGATVEAARARSVATVAATPSASPGAASGSTPTPSCSPAHSMPPPGCSHRSRPNRPPRWPHVGYADVALVALAVPIDGIDRPLDGSGFLVAQPEGLLLTACSWASSKWAHLADPDVALLRASVGRADDTRANRLDDGELVEAVRADLAITMGLRAEPSETRVTRWARALPQFEVGHLDRVRAWRSDWPPTIPGLEVAGAGMSGLGIPACIGQGRAAARSLWRSAR